MNLAQNDAGGYLNSMRGDDYVHIKFEYHIQGIL